MACGVNHFAAIRSKSASINKRRRQCALAAAAAAMKSAAANVCVTLGVGNNGVQSAKESGYFARKWYQ